MISTLHYILYKGGGIDVEFIEHTLKESLPLPVQEEMMTIAEQLKMMGREEGISIGQQKARIEGILRLANKRFGALLSPVIAQIHNASKTALDQLYDRILEAADVDDWVAGL